MIIGLANSGASFAEKNNSESLIESIGKKIRQNPDAVSYFLEGGLDYLNDYRSIAETNYGRRIKDLHVYVASSSGKYTASELNDFMFSLIPQNVQPLESRKSEHLAGFLRFGNLYIKQKVGEVTETMELTDESILKSPQEALERSGFHDGKKITKKDLYVGILIKVFPDEVLLNNYINTQTGTDYISDVDLAQHRQKMIRRLPN